MQIIKKILIILLTLGYLSLNGMSKEEGSSIEQNGQSFKPLKLKSQCAREVLGLIKSGKMSWSDLLLLPEGLARYVSLFNIADCYMHDSLVKDAIEIFRSGDIYTDDCLQEVPREVLENDFAMLINETKALLYEAIGSGSKYLEKFIAALDGFFDYFDASIDIKMYRITGAIDIKKSFQLMKLLLKIMLDPAKASNVIGNYSGTDLEDTAILLEHYFKNAIKNNLVYVADLMLELNIFSRDSMIMLFQEVCNFGGSAQMLRLLEERIEISKVEL